MRVLIEFTDEAGDIASFGRRLRTALKAANNEGLFVSQVDSREEWIEANDPGDVEISGCVRGLPN